MPFVRESVVENQTWKFFLQKFQYSIPISLFSLFSARLINFFSIYNNLYVSFNEKNLSAIYVKSTGKEKIKVTISLPKKHEFPTWWDCRTWRLVALIHSRQWIINEREDSFEWNVTRCNVKKSTNSNNFLIFINICIIKSVHLFWTKSFF